MNYVCYVYHPVHRDDIRGEVRLERLQLGRRYFFSCQLYFFHITLLFVLSSDVSLSYFTDAVYMRKCAGEHSCLTSLFPIAILNGTWFFRSSGIDCVLVWECY